MGHKGKALPHEEEERNIIAIHVEDLTNRRLLEGLAVQLNLLPRFVTDEDLSNPDFTCRVALVVADEPPASRYRALPAIPDHPGDGLHPALVAVLPNTYTGNPLLPKKVRNSRSTVFSSCRSSLPLSWLN